MCVFVCVCIIKCTYKSINNRNNLTYSNRLNSYYI